MYATTTTHTATVVPTPDLEEILDFKLGSPDAVLAISRVLSAAGLPIGDQFTVNRTESEELWLVTISVHGATVAAFAHRKDYTTPSVTMSTLGYAHSGASPEDVEYYQDLIYNAMAGIACPLPF